MHSEDFEVVSTDAERIEARRAADFNGLESGYALNPELARLEFAGLAHYGSGKVEADATDYGSRFDEDMVLDYDFALVDHNLEEPGTDGILAAGVVYNLELVFVARTGILYHPSIFTSEPPAALAVKV